MVPRRSYKDSANITPASSSAVTVASPSAGPSRSTRRQKRGVALYDATTPETPTKRPTKKTKTTYPAPPRKSSSKKRSRRKPTPHVEDIDEDVWYTCPGRGVLKTCSCDVCEGWCHKGSAAEAEYNAL